MHSIACVGVIDLSHIIAETNRRKNSTMLVSVVSDDTAPLHEASGISLGANVNSTERTLVFPSLFPSRARHGFHGPGELKMTG